MWQNGLANQPHSIAVTDGLRLHDAYLTLPVRCAPPENKPTPAEFLTCRKYLSRELELLPNLRVIIPLGALALQAYLTLLKDSGIIASKAAFPFGHGARFSIPGTTSTILASYHPSQQNTFTGLLTEVMLSGVFAEARAIADQ